VLLPWLRLFVPAFLIVGFAWLAAFAVTAIRLNLWPCPRCGHWFFSKMWWRNPFARACLHCGLPKWAAGP
jgi:hypothetical protein